jgi:hypothetical protein
MELWMKAVNFRSFHPLAHHWLMAFFLESIFGLEELCSALRCHCWALPVLTNWKTAFLLPYSQPHGPSLLPDEVQVRATVYP